ncbi:MATH and LRR domain-containing protein PFE0570w isoform X1 [Nymphalis io]|uniref:MATH and LRR domain-containing protein PFE0570w isoform X1 n=1 Tax=Inachis io TaxID=171585 RepID=UPI00216A1EDF|nr:MATH and LRR domain-containing protein PFE0570w isoform X1 [Nymphalis io]XP_050344071.1 MATH and LRR domain-containing protein PFE0570w isoform X1 [Nymphalis io]
MFDQQMRLEETRYPVDRYLVESSKKFDMINIIDDDIWNSEPALRPEDEIILRKLHDMLQSTADDLKLLSGELSKYHGLDVQKKTLPMPLDEEFNEKVHIEEVVNAKFHGHNIIETKSAPNRKHKDVVDGIIQTIAGKHNTKQFVHHGVQVNEEPTLKKSSIKKNLGVSRTNVVQISENPSKKLTSPDSSVHSKRKNMNSYSEFAYKSTEPKTLSVKTPLQIQEMPSINIRSELKEQKVLQIDINPECRDVCDNNSIKHNALVIEMKHEDTPKPVSKKKFTFDHVQLYPIKAKPMTRKISTMSAYESIESANNVSSESQDNLKKQKIKSTITLRATQRTNFPISQKTRKNIVSKKDIKRDGKGSLDEWQKRLKTVYGESSKVGNSGVKVTKVSSKLSNKQKNTSKYKVTSKGLNNTEYIPYSKLTLGGVNVSDIEREISSIRNRGDVVLSPILDKILSSRENSFNKDTPRKSKNKSSKILTTSDENLLQDVLNIEKEITRTLPSENANNDNKISDNGQINVNCSFRKGDSYADDFEDEKSEDSNKTQISDFESLDSKPSNNSKQDKNNDPNDNTENEINEQDNTHNKTFTKVSNLSFKNKVDIFEFIHSVDTQDTGVQSNTADKTMIQETQTSSNDDKPKVQPIHNDLWPSSIDPRGEVETMFKLEKEFIKKLIIDEYGDILEKQFNKPSTSKNIDNDNSDRNVSSSQKNTQTSPAHVKSVMTSPTRTKTRTTSPFALSLSVNQQTSPIVVLSNEEQLKVEIENDEDLGISVNLSSPRFSLRLPQTSREVISNIKSGLSNKRELLKPNNVVKSILNSSSSIDGDYSSSDISSLGEIHKMYKRRLRKSRIPSISEISSSSSSVSRYSKYSSDPSGAIIPLRSEGEASIRKTNVKRSNKLSKSEGEMSFGQL